MLRSLYSGVSGLQAHQTMMDTVGNNIANVNTVGYKSSSVDFEDTLSQELIAPTGAQNGNGGTNPAQVGLGVKLGAITTNFAQGSLQNTGTSTNMGLQGDGFFVVQQGGQQLFTRAGDFSLDSTGELVSPDGGVVQGWVADTAGNINSNTTPGALKLPLGITMPAVETSTASLVGNLSAGTVSGTSVAPAGITMYDAKGNATPVSFGFTAAGPDPVTGDDTWTMTATDNQGNSLGTQTLDFDSSGKLTTTSPVSYTINGAPVAVDITGLTEFGGSTTAQVSAQNGSAPGSLTSFSIGEDGTVTGIFSNGLKQSLGQVAVASFTNPPGLEREGDSLFSQTISSGDPKIGVANSDGRGTISSGEVEMSDEILSDLVQMIH
jgi:flagellar hook protein FlgE